MPQDKSLYHYEENIISEESQRDLLLAVFQMARTDHKLHQFPAQVGRYTKATRLGWTASQEVSRQTTRISSKKATCHATIYYRERGGDHTLSLCSKLTLRFIDPPLP